MYVSEKCYMKYRSIPSPSTVHPPVTVTWKPGLPRSLVSNESNQIWKNSLDSTALTLSLPLSLAVHPRSPKWNTPES